MRTRNSPRHAGVHAHAHEGKRSALENRDRRKKESGQPAANPEGEFQPLWMICGVQRRCVVAGNGRALGPSFPQRRRAVRVFADARDDD